MWLSEKVKERERRGESLSDVCPLSELNKNRERERGKNKRKKKL